MSQFSPLQQLLRSPRTDQTIRASLNSLNEFGCRWLCLSISQVITVICWRFTWVRMILVALKRPSMEHDRQLVVIFNVAVLDRTRWNSWWLITAFCGPNPRCQTRHWTDPIHGSTSSSLPSEIVWKNINNSCKLARISNNRMMSVTNQQNRKWF